MPFASGFNEECQLDNPEDLGALRAGTSVGSSAVSSLLLGCLPQERAGDTSPRVFSASDLFHELSEGARYCRPWTDGDLQFLCMSLKSLLDTHSAESLLA